MPRKYRRRYKRRYRRRKRKRKTKGTVYKIATRAAQAVLNRNSTANYVQEEVGTYVASTGQWTVEDHVDIKPGPNNGNLFIGPKISLDAAQAGKPGFRADNKVMLKAVRLRLFFDMPDGLDTAYLRVYVAKCKNGDMLPSNFNCPDNITMMRDDKSDVENLYALKILRIRNLTLNAEGNVMSRVRKIDIYHQFRKPEILEFQGATNSDYLNKEFMICIKSSYQLPGVDEYVVCYGSVQWYYRDIA